MAEAAPQHATGDQAGFPFDNTYARLPERFFTKLDPTPVQAPSLLLLNEELARELNLDPAFLRSEAGAQVLGGNTHFVAAQLIHCDDLIRGRGFAQGL